MFACLIITSRLNRIVSTSSVRGNSRRRLIQRRQNVQSLRNHPNYTGISTPRTPPPPYSRYSSHRPHFSPPLDSDDEPTTWSLPSSSNSSAPSSPIREHQQHSLFITPRSADLNYEHFVHNTVPLSNEVTRLAANTHHFNNDANHAVTEIAPYFASNEQLQRLTPVQIVRAALNPAHASTLTDRDLAQSQRIHQEYTRFVQALYHIIENNAL